MGVEDVCSIGLDLGLACHENIRHQTREKPCFKFSSSSPSLTLALGDENNNNNNSDQASKSPLSSFSNASIKRERDEDMEVERRVISDEDEEGSGGRKKLRLTKDQSALLEESFKQHSTLNPKQKQALAKELNLRPRQVEVWFQNRRARTKLKQTEVDCEVLRKCCQTLTEENRRLHKELQDLKALKLTSSPLYMQIPSSATLTMCPSCEKINGGGGGGGENSSKNSKSVTIATKPLFYNPFTHPPSAAC